MKHPGAIVRALREKAGITQAEFAKRLGVSATFLCDVELERAPISTSLAIRLEREMGKTAEFWAEAQARYDVAKAKEAG